MRSLVFGGVVGCMGTSRRTRAAQAVPTPCIFSPPHPNKPDSALHPSDLPNRPAGLRAATDNTVNTFTAPAGCESRRPHGSLRPAPCEPPAPGQNRPAGLRRRCRVRLLLPAMRRPCSLWWSPACWPCRPRRRRRLPHQPLTISPTVISPRLGPAMPFRLRAS